MRRTSIIFAVLAAMLSLSSSAKADPVKLVPIGGSVSSGNSYTAVTDGNPNTVWNSGGWAPAWIELDLGQAMPISKIRLLKNQSPVGAAIHTVTAGATHSSMRTVYTINDCTDPNNCVPDNGWLEVSGDGLNGDHLGHVRYIRITTNSSPSWIAWREIEIYGAVEYFGYYFGYGGMGAQDIPATAAVGANLMVIDAASSSLTSLLATVGQYHTKAIIDLGLLLYADHRLKGGVSCAATDPGCWLYAWSNMKTAINNGGYQHNIASFYVYDEPDLWLIPPAEVTKVVTQVRADFGIPTSLLLTADAVKQAIPATGDLADWIHSVDWVGFDCYTTPPWQGYGQWDRCANAGNNPAVSIPTMIANLRSALHSNQRMIALPTSFLWPGADPDSGQEWQIENNIGYWHSEILSDGKYIMVWPFLWPANGLSGYPGAASWPLIQQRLKQLAASFMPLWADGALRWTRNIFFNGYQADTSENALFNAFDGNPSSLWSSGGFPVKRIWGWLWDYTHISRVELTMFLDNYGQATNRLWLHTASGWIVASDFVGQSQGQGVKLIWTGSADVDEVEVDTNSSPSWVKWWDIMIYK